MKPEGEVEMVCPDVYDFPFISERFAAELIEIMEKYGSYYTYAVHNASGYKHLRKVVERKE